MKEQIYKNVLKAMQDAEELGGTRDEREYVDLMTEIAAEALKRRNCCIANNELTDIQPALILLTNEK